MQKNGCNIPSSNLISATPKSKEYEWILQPNYLQRPGIKKAPVQPDGGEEEFIQLFRQLSPEVQERELAYLRQLAAHEAVQDK